MGKPRLRKITEELFKDEQFAVMEPLARVLWIGLIATADDQGRMTGYPGLVRSRVLPVDDVSIDEVDAILDMLAGMGWIIRYTSRGKHLIQIVNWWKHQRMRYAIPSEYDPPDGWVDKINYTGPGKKPIRSNWTKDKPGFMNLDTDSDDDNDTISDAYTGTYADIFTLWDQEMKVLPTQIMSEEIADMANEIGMERAVDWFREAITIAVNNNIRKWSYVKAILQDWITKGYVASGPKAKKDTQHNATREWMKKKVNG